MQCLENRQLPCQTELWQTGRLQNRQGEQQEQAKCADTGTQAESGRGVPDTYLADARAKAGTGENQPTNQPINQSVSQYMNK